MPLGRAWVWGLAGWIGVALPAAAGPADLVGCFSVAGPQGPVVARVYQDGKRFTGTFKPHAQMRLGVMLDADLHSTRVMLEEDDRFLAVAQDIQVVASLSSRTDILAQVATPLVPPYQPELGPAPFVYWALEDDMLAAWKVACPTEN